MEILRCRSCIDNKQYMLSPLIGGKYKPSGGFGAVRESYCHKPAAQSDAKWRRCFFRRIAVLAAYLLFLLGLAASSSATTVTLTVQADEDDAQETGYGGASWDNSGDYYLRVVQWSSGNEKHSGFRFSGATIPNGATINSATFKPYLSTAVNDDLYCKIYGEAVNSSYDFSYTQSVVSRSRTTAYTAISVNSQGAGWKNYDVRSAVQEIVNRAGWSSGNALTLLMIGNTNSTYKEAQFYSVGGGVGAQLVVDYTPPAPNLNQLHYRWRNDDGYEESGPATVAVDAVSTYSTTGTTKVSPATVSHTVSGSNRLLLVGVTLWPSTMGDTVTSVTWNGTSLTKITHAQAGSAIRTELWKLLAPATGTYNIVVTFSRALNCTVGAISFTGVNQSDPYRAASTGTGTSTSASITVASATGEMVLSVAGAGTANYNFNSFSGDTERWNLSSATYPKGAGGTTAGAGSVTATHGIANNNSWAIIGLPIKPASLTAATWAANEDTQLSGLTKNATKRLRFLVSNTGAASSTATYKLQSAQAATCSSGTYGDIPTDTSGTWKITDTTYVTEPAASNNVASGLTDPAGKTFVAGQLKDADNTTGSISLTSSQFTEVEYAIQATDNAQLGANYCFRLWDAAGNKAMDTYTVYAQATLESMSLTQNHFRWRNDNGGETAGALTPTVVNANSGVSAYGNLITIPLTVSGSNRLVLVGISYYFYPTNPYNPPLISYVRWNGTDLNYITGQLYYDYAATYIYSLIAPEAGTYNIQVQFSDRAYAVAGAVSFANVDQATPLGTANSVGVNTSSPSIAVTTSPGDLVFGVIDTRDQNQTGRNADTLHWDASTSYVNAEGVTKAATSSSTTLSWTLGSIAVSGISAVPVKGTSYSAATFATNEDVKVGVRQQTPIRLRIMVSNGAASSTGSLQYQLQVAETATCSSGSYTAISSDTDWQMVNSDYFTDGAATTNVASGLTDPPGYSFAAGQLKDTSDTTAGINLSASNFTELEFSVQTTASATSLGDYCFRLYNTTSGAVLNTYTNYAIAKVNGPTAIKLLSFSATGAGEAVKVSWQTAQESENKGFNLYRAQSLGGPYVQLNAKLIASQSLGGEGRDYEFIDTQASRGAIYYYKLEDVDVSGTHTPNGPVCVDWDGDGIPDDWEIVYGLNPGVNDANLESDGDGVLNWLEYARGTDPFNPDTDGDGITDGAEKKNPGYSGGSGSSLSADASVQVLASDSRGMTLELVTKSFDVTPVTAGGQAFERLRVPSYVHGFTLAAGLPQVPVKGILIDIPAGKQARVEVLDSASRVLAGYRVYPAPLHQAGANNQVAEVFSWDEAAYRENAYYPAVAAELSTEYVFRGQAQQRLIFYPLQFNPATGELLHPRPWACFRTKTLLLFAGTGRKPSVSGVFLGIRPPPSGRVVPEAVRGLSEGPAIPVAGPLLTPGTVPQRSGGGGAGEGRDGRSRGAGRVAQVTSEDGPGASSGPCTIGHGPRNPVLIAARWQKSAHGHPRDPGA